MGKVTVDCNIICSPPPNVNKNLTNTHKENCFRPPVIALEQGAFLSGLIQHLEI